MPYLGGEYFHGMNVDDIVTSWSVHFSKQAHDSDSPLGHYVIFVVVWKSRSQCQENCVSTKEEDLAPSTT